MNFLSWLGVGAPAQRPSDLIFLNQTRSYSETKHCVSFWGFDGSFEIAFDVTEGELHRLSPHKGDEESILRAFDQHRPELELMAGAAHRNSRQRRHLLS
jgi:hypothetical protein